MRLLEWFWEYVAHLRLFWQIPLKLCLLILFILLVLFPNPTLLLKQLSVYGNVDSLIQTDFDGIDQINQEITAVLPNNVTREQEFTAVQRYVYEHIAYAYDWENWLNIDYWPTAAEVWNQKQEDCDGQAVLAASILRSRGFSSAKLAGNMRHIWVAVDRDALMGPESEQTIRREDGKVRITLPSWELLLGSFAIGLADFQEFRSLLIYFGVLLTCYHPCCARSRFFGVTTLGLVGFIFLKDWADQVMTTYKVTTNMSFWGGVIFLLSSIILSLGMQKILKHRP